MTLTLWYGDLFAEYNAAQFEQQIAHERKEIKNLNDKAYSAYWHTAGEIEARDAAARRGMTAEERKATAPAQADENTVFADGSGEQGFIGKTTSNKPFVEVTDDILAGVPQSDWVKTVKNNLKNKFPNGITVGNNQIAIDAESRRELTYSRYMQWLHSNDPQIRADKLRATNNVDEILKATTDWIDEGLNHPRKDSIQDFARGNVLIRVGGNDYIANVVVGTKANGQMKLYDVLYLQPTSFTAKEMGTAKTAYSSPSTSRNTATIWTNMLKTARIPGGAKAPISPCVTIRSLQTVYPMQRRKSTWKMRPSPTHCRSCSMDSRSRRRCRSRRPWSRRRSR